MLEGKESRKEGRSEIILANGCIDRSDSTHKAACLLCFLASSFLLGKLGSGVRWHCRGSLCCFRQCAMDDKGDKDGDGDFEASAFEALEKDFQEILQELVGDKSLEHFRQQYEKLHRALKKSHESEKHLIKKCRELNAEIVSNAVKVQTALKLSQEDQATITALKKEIERAWKMVETSHEKEQRARDTIQNLKMEISKLGRLVEQGAGLSINQENMVNQLVQEKNDLIKHRDMLQGQVGQLQQQNTDLRGKVSKLDTERQAGGNELATLKSRLEKRLEDADKEAKLKERLDKDLKDL